MYESQRLALRESFVCSRGEGEGGRGRSLACCRPRPSLWTVCWLGRVETRVARVKGADSISYTALQVDSVLQDYEGLLVPFGVGTSRQRCRPLRQSIQWRWRMLPHSINALLGAAPHLLASPALRAPPSDNHHHAFPRVSRDIIPSTTPFIGSTPFPFIHPTPPHTPSSLSPLAPLRRFPLSFRSNPPRPSAPRQSRRGMLSSRRRRRRV